MKARKQISTAVQFIIFLVSLTGILMQCGIFNGRVDFSVLNYFTIMSNVGCCLYSLAGAVHALKRGTVFMPRVKGMLLVAIATTGLVYHFMLHGRFEMQGTIALSNLLLHYAVPILFVLQWVLFDKKGSYTWKEPLLWALFPLFYFVYVFIRVALGGKLGPYGSAYPYYFMDVEALGWGTVLIINLCIAAMLILLGYVFVAADRLLARFSSSKKRTQSEKQNPQT